MKSSFHGWRRKTGIVSLGMTLTLMVGWMRSLMIHDHILFYPPGSAFQFIVSASGAISWVRVRLFPSFYENDDYLPAWSSMPLLEVEDSDYFWQNRTKEWRWSCGEFDFGAGEHYDGIPRVERWAVPYWSLTLPPTLLSAYLIFGKPRKVE